MKTYVKTIGWLKARYKAVMSALGGLLGLLYTIAAANPNKYVLTAIVILTVAGVHQATNTPQS